MKKTLIPIIDVSAIYTNSIQKKEDLAKQINHAAISTGVFLIKGLNINTNDAYKYSKLFHSRPTRYKEKFTIGKNNRHAGYVPFSEKGLYQDEKHKRRYESFDLSLDLDLDESNKEYLSGNIFYGPIYWPDIPKFKKVIYDYFLSMLDAGRKITSIMEIALGIEKNSLTSKMQNPTSQLRLLHYIKNDDPIDIEDANMGAHTDYECFTILSQDTKGLQSQTTNGDWIDIPIIKDTFVLNIGDTLECLTNGYWKSNSHRVINTKEERFSIPYFCALDYHTKIRPIEKFINKSNPEKNYEEIVAGEHLLAQVTRDFKYLRELHKKGMPFLSKKIPNSNPFQYTVNNINRHP
jgi:isopenicillin N synthase-like dioxygenase